MIILQGKSEDMQITKIESSQPKKRNGYLMAGAGALAGAAATAVLPTKQEIKNIINKQAVDSFVSTSATKARLADRSVGKFALIGALGAMGINFLSKVFAPKPQTDTSIEYSKWGAIIDASDYACMVTWYGDTNDNV